MAKRKGRAARKQQREKAAKAEDHGLPAPALAPKPQKTRKVGGDTVAAAVASEKAGRTGPRRRAAPPPETGMPMAVKVLVGAIVALLIVFALSQLRKSGSVASPAQPESFRGAEGQSTAPTSATDQTDAVVSDAALSQEEAPQEEAPQDQLELDQLALDKAAQEDVLSDGATPREPRATAPVSASSSGSTPATVPAPRRSPVPVAPALVGPAPATPAPVAPAPVAPTPAAPSATSAPVAPPAAPVPATSSPAE